MPAENDEEIADALQEFRIKFTPALGNRAQAMEIISAYYLNHNEDRPVIIETGTTKNREASDLLAQSTMVFDFLTSYCENGQVLSVDLSDETIEKGKWVCSDRVSVIRADSVYALSNTDPELLVSCGVVYLDSHCLDVTNPWPSAMHHMKELAAIYACLPIGCVIAVGDTHNEKTGKHILISDFLKHTDCRKVYQGVITIWIKR